MLTHSFKLACENKCNFLSSETCWALASPPLSIRSWYWLPSRRSGRRSSRCMAAVCRSKQRTHLCSLAAHPHRCAGGEEEGALPYWKKDEQIFQLTALLLPSHPHAFLNSFFLLSASPQRPEVFETRGQQRRDVMRLFVIFICTLTFNNCVSSILLTLDQCIQRCTCTCA